MATKRNQEDVNHAREMLTKYAPKGSKVYTVVRHVSRSGMSRSISLHVVSMTNDGPEIVDVTGWAALVLGWPLDRRNWGLKIGGCGMDMAFHTVYSLAQKLYSTKENREGYALTKVDL